MSIISRVYAILQEFREVQLPKLQPQLEELNNHNVKPFVPEVCHDYLSHLFAQSSAIVKISKARISKHGDFKVDQRYNIPTITVNQNLNPYAFLITLLHEWAHLLVHLNYPKNVSPHGQEWKKTYKILLSPLLEMEALDKDFRFALTHHLKNPKASTGADVKFAKALTKYDQHTVTVLDDLMEGDLFQLNNGLILIKGPKRRTRYLCNSNTDKRQFAVHSLAEVLPIKQ